MLLVGLGLLLGMRAPARAVTLTPGDNLQTIIDANPPGTTFTLTAGTFRLQQNSDALYVKAGNTFTGSGRGVTILSGAKILTGWIQSGTLWYVTGQTQAGFVNGIGCPGSDPGCLCYTDHPRCIYPEELFFDNTRKILIGVHDTIYNDSLALVGPGTWYFDYTTDRIYVGDDPTGHVVETSVASFAFGGASLPADNVTIQDMTIEKIASFTQYGAIDARLLYASLARTTGWIIRNVDLRWIHGSAIRTGDGTQVLGNFIYENGILGIGSDASNTVVSHNTIMRNNQAWYSAANEAGGIKYAGGGANNVFSDNEIYDNNGPGLWCDYCGTGNQYLHNTVYNNMSEGILLEVTGGSFVANNTVRLNASSNAGWLYGAQILLSSSWATEVVGNRVMVAATYGNGITILDQNRPAGSPVINNTVHDNVVVHLAMQGLSGAAADYAPSPILTDNNQFQGNTYCVPVISGTFWTWGAAKDWTQWHAVPQDTTGALVLAGDCPPRRAALSCSSGSFSEESLCRIVSSFQGFWPFLGLVQ